MPHATYSNYYYLFNSHLHCWVVCSFLHLLGLTPSGLFFSLLHYSKKEDIVFVSEASSHKKYHTFKAKRQSYLDARHEPRRIEFDIQWCVDMFPCSKNITRDETLSKCGAWIVIGFALTLIVATAHGPIDYFDVPSDADTEFRCQKYTVTTVFVFLFMLLFLSRLFIIKFLARSLIYAVTEWSSPSNQ